MRIAICDDEMIMTNKINALLDDCLRRKNIINNLVEVFHSGLNLINHIEKFGIFDLIYLDIEMPDLDGISLARKIRNNNEDALIIYISSYDNYLAELFPVRPFRFIKKPIDTEVFVSNFDAAVEEINRTDIFFHYDFKSIRYRVALKNILYFESLGRRIYMVTFDKTEHFTGKMNDIEARILKAGGQFLRIHQSYLINVKLVSEISFETIVMCNGNTLRISQDKRSFVRRALMSMED